jgi:hypothetical protein
MGFLNNLFGKKRSSADIDKFADVNQIEDESSGSTKLHIACSSGNVQEVKKLLKQGAAVNAPNKWGATPLDLVCSNNTAQHRQAYSEIASLIIAKGGVTNTWKGDRPF